MRLASILTKWLSIERLRLPQRATSFKCSLSDEKKQLFKRVLPLGEQQIQISEMDKYEANSQHPLSRFRVSFGNANNATRESAGWLLGRAATDPEERSVVVSIALDWVRSDDSGLQYTGALLLTQPNLSPNGVNSAELSKHTNPSVRRASLRMSDMQTCPETTTLEQLASDREQKVQIAVAQALPSLRSINVDAYERIRARLNIDPSALVRACASTLPRCCNLPSA